MEIAELHWNWGSFWCGWLWCFVNALPGLAVLILGIGALVVYLTLALLPAGYALPSELLALVLFGLHCHLGIRGHQLAWEHRRFYGGMAQYFAVQRAWLVGGGIAFVLAVSVLTVSTLKFMKAFHAYEARLHRPIPPSKPAAPSSPPPMILRPPLPAQSNAPTYLRSPTNGEDGFGRRGLRRPWEFGPARPQYQPGSGPSDVRMPPDVQVTPQANPQVSPVTGPDAGLPQNPTPPATSSVTSAPEGSSPTTPSEQPLLAEAPNSSATPEVPPPSSGPASSSSPTPSNGSAP